MAYTKFHSSRNVKDTCNAHNCLDNQNQSMSSPTLLGNGKIASSTAVSRSMIDAVNVTISQGLSNDHQSKLLGGSLFKPEGTIGQASFLC